jgi:hypothetical protein
MSNEQRTWLIRHQDRTFSRPLSESELQELFDAGAMNPQDEICCANEYWFSVQDVKEMRSHFGDISFEGIFKKVKDEVTAEREMSTAKIIINPEVLKVELKKNEPPKVVREVESSISTTQVNAIERESHAGKIIFAVLTILIVLLFVVWLG